MTEPGAKYFPSLSSSERRSFWRHLYAPALAGLRIYWWAFIGIQACAAGVVVFYFLSPPMQVGCQGLAQWRADGGLWFAALANIISGTVLPETIKILARPADRARPTWADLLHQATLFALLGVLVDRFYALQIWLFGDSGSWGVVAVKILVDQFIYSPLIAIPLVVVWFMWRECRYQIGATLRLCTFQRIAERGLQLFGANVAFWIPVLVCIYTLPGDLQFLFFLCVNTAWCLLLVFMANRQSGR